MAFIIISSITLLSILFLALTFSVIRYRRRYQVAYGVTDDRKFQAAMSAQRNFVDSVPFILLLILYLSIKTSATWMVSIPLIMLVVGRYCHGFGLLVLEQRKQASYKGRATGMILTFLSLIFTVIALIAILFSH